MDMRIIWDFLQEDNKGNSTSSSNERITEDGQTRFTENNETRVIE